MALKEAPNPLEEQESIVNDFVINVATVNGSGSQTSNGVLLRAFFKMGIPVNGKNLFPSNIQGLPTWYIIRLNKDGYLARREETDIQVCMNGRTVAEDMAQVIPGGVIFYDDSLPIANRRKDVTYYPMPVKDLVKQADLPFSLRDYVANMVYVGVLAYVLEIDMAEIEAALAWNFDNKPKPIALNLNMVKAAYAWAEENLQKQDPFQVARMSGFNEGKVMVDGNTAAALGAIFNGLTVASWYPITPASSLAETITRYAHLRKEPETGLSTIAVVQAEDELAAAGMVMGAGWAGARAMTSTSGPGMSLMAEFAGLSYFAEIPAVVWNVQRMGPSTGLPTRTSQGDIISAYYLSHGDTRHVVLFPADPAECFDFAGVAFDLAERLQTLVLVLSDLDLGMNLHISEPFTYPEQPLDRGKVLNAEELKALSGSWGRFVDVDGDGIGYRTLPGTETPLAAYFTRGTGHNAYAVYSERSEDWEENLARIHRKFETARDLVPAPIVHEDPDADIGIISLGTNDPAVLEAQDRLNRAGIPTSYLRLRALPINQAVRDFIRRYDKVVVVESNQDGQLCQILRSEVPKDAGKLISAAKCDGLSISPRFIVESIQAQIATGESEEE
jgi:2-oxoglutarate ferredoxin oxidoreductase subunit alpha